MAGRYDIDALLTDIQTVISTQLNTFITAVNTDKNDGITCAMVDFNRADAIHLQYIKDSVELADPFILFGLADDTEAASVGGSASRTYQIDIVLVVYDSGNDPSIVRKLYRYQRALEDLVLGNWDALGKGARLKLLGKQPTPAFKLLSKSNEYRAVGVTLQTVIA